MKPIDCEDSIYIERPIAEVFEFLANPNVKREELTPSEDQIIKRSEMRGLGAVSRATVEFAARELEYLTRCIEYEPPYRLTHQFEGDLEGRESWQLSLENTGTRAQLTLCLVRPDWTPAYLRDDITADRWGRMWVDQTLTNIKSALEQPQQ